jgi:hypothetical protein
VDTGIRFLRIGASSEEVDMRFRNWKRWIEDVDGWMRLVNCEAIWEVGMYRKRATGAKGPAQERIRVSCVLQG